MTVELVEFPALKQERDALNAKRDSLAGILAEAGPTYDMSLVKSLPGDTHAKVAEIGKLNAEIDERKKKVDELLVLAKAAGEAKLHAEKGKAGKGERGSEPGGDDGRETKGGRRKSFGELAVESDAIKAYVSGSGAGPVSRIDVTLKALFQTSAGWDPEDTRIARVEMFPTRPAPHVVDAVPQTTTDKSTVLYMEETVFSNTAAETAEGSQYPEARLEVTERSSEVRKVAVFLPVTDEQFEDEPRARSYVENRLPFMLRQRLDGQILTGSGAGVNLRGTENVSGINTQAKGADPVPDAVYKGMRLVRDAGFAEPSHVFLRAAVWEPIRLLRTADGVYIWGHPAMAAPETIWGVPVVQTNAAPSTKVLLGDYTNYSELAVRRGIDMQISNSHGTFFIEGKLAVRVDLRAALIHYRPLAFAAITGVA